MAGKKGSIQRRYDQDSEHPLGLVDDEREAFGSLIPSSPRQQVLKGARTSEMKESHDRRPPPRHKKTDRPRNEETVHDDGHVGPTRPGLQKVPASVGHDTGSQRKPHGRPRANPTAVKEDGGHGPDGKRANYLHDRASTTSRVTTKKKRGPPRVPQADRQRQTATGTPVAAAERTHNQQSVVVPRATQPSPFATQPHTQPTARARPAASVTCLGTRGMSRAATQARAPPSQPPRAPPCSRRWTLDAARLPHTRNRGAARPARRPSAADATRGPRGGGGEGGNRCAGAAGRSGREGGGRGGGHGPDSGGCPTRRAPAAAAGCGDCRRLAGGGAALRPPAGSTRGVWSERGERLGERGFWRPPGGA